MCSAERTNDTYTQWQWLKHGMRSQSWWSRFVRKVRQRVTWSWKISNSILLLWVGETRAACTHARTHAQQMDCVQVQGTCTHHTADHQQRWQSLTNSFILSDVPASRGSPVNLRRPRKRLSSKVKRSCTASDEGGHPVQLYRVHNTTRRRVCTCVCVQKKRKCRILVVRLLGGGCSLCVKVCGRDRQGEGARWLGTACTRAATCFSSRFLSQKVTFLQCLTPRTHITPLLKVRGYDARLQMRALRTTSRSRYAETSVSHGTGTSPTATCSNKNIFQIALGESRCLSRVRTHGRNICKSAERSETRPYAVDLSYIATACIAIKTIQPRRKTTAYSLLAAFNNNTGADFREWAHMFEF